MTQVPGSNAAGEVFADFKLNPEQALAALKELEDKALEVGQKIENSGAGKASPAFDRIGKSATSLGTALGALTGSAGATAGALGQMAGAAGPAGAAIAAVLAATLSLEKGIREFNNAGLNFANSMREINDTAGDFANIIAKASDNFDDLERAAQTFNERELIRLQNEIEKRSLYAKVRDEFQRALGGESLEESKINQILIQREQLLALIAKRREDAFTEAVADRDRKRRNEEELRLANALNDLEKQRNTIRKEGFTEQQKQVDSLRETIAVINDLLATTDNPQTAQALGEYAKFFAERLDVVMQPVIEDLAEKFARSVQEKFAGVFDTGSLTDQFGNVTGKLDAIAAQLQNRGAL